MRRRTFLKAAGGAALAGGGALDLFASRSAAKEGAPQTRLLDVAGRPLGPLPHVSGPRVSPRPEGDPAKLVNTKDDTLLIVGDARVSLGFLEGTRGVCGADGT